MKASHTVIGLRTTARTSSSVTGRHRTGGPAPDAADLCAHTASRPLSAKETLMRASTVLRTIAVAAASAVALTLAACTPGGGGDGDGPSSDYVTEGKLTIGTG